MFKKVDKIIIMLRNMQNWISRYKNVLSEMKTVLDWVKSKHCGERY